MHCKHKQVTEDYKVCGCVNIWYEHLVREIKAGADTIEKLKERTSVSTGCGTCLAAVEKILATELAQNCK